jgi:hypothetical protein
MEGVLFKLELYLYNKKEEKYCNLESNLAWPWHIEKGTY